MSKALGAAARSGSPRRVGRRRKLAPPAEGREEARLKSWPTEQGGSRWSGKRRETL